LKNCIELNGLDFFYKIDLKRIGAKVDQIKKIGFSSQPYMRE